jgi:type I restriction enzyme S subunit
MSEATGGEKNIECGKTVRLGPRKISIPANWSVVPFEEAVELNPQYEKPNDGPFGYLPMDAVDENKQIIKYWTEREKKNCTNTWFKNGDTVYAKITPCTENGKIAFVDDLDTEVGSGSTEFLVFHPRDGVTDERFVYYLSNLPEFRSVTISLMEGSTGRQRVPNDVFKGGIEVPLPPLPEQRRIANILSLVDEQIQQTDQIIERTKELKVGLIQDLFKQGIRGETRVQRDIGPMTYEIPKSWDIVPANKVCSDITVGIVSGATEHYVEAGVPFIRSKNIDENRMNDYDLKYIDEEFHKDNLNSELKSGDVLTQRTGQNGGITAVVPDRYQGANCFSMLISRTNERIDEHFYAYYLNSQYSRQFIESRKGGGVQKNLNAKFLRQLPIFLPTLDEQQSIVEILSTIDQKIDEEVSYKKMMRELKHGLTQDLLTGKVRVEPDD